MITPFLIVCSVVTEVSLPYLMAKVIDNGINLGFGSKYVIKIGTIMLVLVLFSLICEVLAAKTDADREKQLHASMPAMHENRLSRIFGVLIFVWIGYRFCKLSFNVCAHINICKNMQI